MNTPKTRKTKRYKPRSLGELKNPDGRYMTGLWNERFALLLGQLVSYWPIVEDKMIGILADLLSYPPSTGTNGPPRQIFKSVISNQARRKLMLSLLERSRINKDKEQFYDEVIEEFAKLNAKRNGYVHGIWYTHQETNQVYLAEESIDDFHFHDRREITEQEIAETLRRMEGLLMRIIRRHRGELDKGLSDASPPSSRAGR